MERKEYLKLCQRNAIGKKVYVFFDHIKYIPIEFKIWFDSQGTPHNSGVLKDIKTKSGYVIANIERVEMYNG